MRSATITITPETGGLYPADRRLAAEPAVSRVVIHEVNLLEDSTCVALYELAGDLDRADELLRDASAVMTHELGGEATRVTYIHFRPNTVVRELLEVVQTTAIVLETPIECRDDGGISVVIVGDDETIQRAVDRVPDALPLSLSLEGIGPYARRRERVLAGLTDRQREILEMAIEAGYYEKPRRTTHSELAARLDIAESTVGDHLRAIESKLVSAITT